MIGLDEEEIWHADFRRGVGVYSVPTFIDPIAYEEGIYAQALAEQQVCKINLEISRKANKDIPAQLGKKC